MIDMKLLSKAVRYILKHCSNEFRNSVKLNNVSTDTDNYNKYIISFYQQKVGVKEWQND